MLCCKPVDIRLVSIVEYAYDKDAVLHVVVWRNSQIPEGQVMMSVTTQITDGGMYVLRVLLRFFDTLVLVTFVPVSFCCGILLLIQPGWVRIGLQVRYCGLGRMVLRHTSIL
jgi:hypothetical protein